jgi:hypothetical protein
MDMSMYSNDEGDFESWQNATRGRVVITKLDARGQKRHDMVGPGKIFHVTPRERRMNQELAANEDQDVFMNGTLQPVRLLEGTEDAKEIAASPNHISETDVKGLFKAHHKTFEKRVAEITNPATLERLLEVAREDEVNATVRQVELVQARLAEVAPNMADERTPVVVDGNPGSSPETGLKPVTPR